MFAQRKPYPTLSSARRFEKDKQSHLRRLHKQQPSSKHPLRRGTTFCREETVLQA